MKKQEENTEALLFKAVTELAELSVRHYQDELDMLIKWGKETGEIDVEHSQLIDACVATINAEKERVYNKYGITKQTQGKIL